MQENEKTYERDIYMEERNEELEMSADTELKKETEIQTSENSEKASADSEPEKKERPAANFGLLLLAGVYLLYTGYKLCANVLKGEEGASWGFFIAGAAFLIICGSKDCETEKRCQKGRSGGRGKGTSG